MLGAMEISAKIESLPDDQRNQFGALVLLMLDCLEVGSRKVATVIACDTPSGSMQVVSVNASGEETMALVCTAHEMLHEAIGTGPGANSHQMVH